MPGFKKTGGKDTETKERTIAALALAVGDLVMADRANAVVVAATAAATVSLLQGGGIVTKATTVADTKVVLHDIVYGATYKVQAANATNVAHNYMRMALTDLNTVNNSGVDDAVNGVFMQTGVADATHIIGEFIPALT